MCKPEGESSSKEDTKQQECPDTVEEGTDDTSSASESGNISSELWENETEIQWEFHHVQAHPSNNLDIWTFR